MRRTDRAVEDIDTLEAMLAAARVCYLAFSGGDYPYVVPLHYGYIRAGDSFRLYMHCANAGDKLDRMRADPRVAFAVDCAYTIVPGEGACRYTTRYESVMGQGVLRETSGADKHDGLMAIMRQVAPGKSHGIPRESLAGVTVLRLDVNLLTGKRNGGPVREQ